MEKLHRVCATFPLNSLIMKLLFKLRSKVLFNLFDLTTKLLNKLATMLMTKLTPRANWS